MLLERLRLLAHFILCTGSCTTDGGETRLGIHLHGQPGQCTALRTMLCKGAPHMHAPVDSDCSVNVQTFDQLGVRGCCARRRFLCNDLAAMVCTRRLPMVGCQLVKHRLLADCVVQGG